jgi:hypothetical protein
MTRPEITIRIYYVNPAKISNLIINYLTNKILSYVNPIKNTIWLTAYLKIHRIPYRSPQVGIGFRDVGIIPEGAV